MQLVGKLSAIRSSRQLQENVLQSSVYLLEKASCPYGTEVDLNMLQNPQVYGISLLTPSLGHYLVAGL